MKFSAKALAACIGTFSVPDDKLFEDPSNVTEECSLCAIRFYPEEKCLKDCCGQSHCAGCFHSVLKAEVKDETKRGDDFLACPYCRSPSYRSEEEFIRRMMALATNENSPHAFANAMIGEYYRVGARGLEKDKRKALAFFLKAAELGCAGALGKLSEAYENGDIVEKDMGKARYYAGRASIEGHLDMRHHLAMMDLRDGESERAFKHFKIAARFGCKDSLNKLKDEFLGKRGMGLVTKADYLEALKDYRDICAKTKSKERAEFYRYLANPSLYLKMADENK